VAGGGFGLGFVGDIGGGKEERWHVEVGDAPAETGKCGAAGDTNNGCAEERGGGFVGHDFLITWDVLTYW
jgi:hypothetical protein